MSESYLIPSASIIIEEEIKHSRFISFLFHCVSEVDMKHELAAIKAQYPGANHYCYAFISDSPDNSIAIGSSDDGEPAGSAGRPMLATLQGANIGEIGAIVVRYFGGTKLGVGGLVRAYSSGLKQGLLQLKTELKQLRYPAVLLCDYYQLKDVEHFLTRNDAVITDKQFSEKVLIEFMLPKACLQSLNSDLAIMSQGVLQVDFESLV